MVVCGALEVGGRGLGVAAVAVDAAVNAVCPRIVLVLNSPNHETGSESGKSVTVGSERPETLNESALEAPVAVGHGPGLGPGRDTTTRTTIASTIGPSSGTFLENRAALERNTTTSNKGTTLRGRDKRLLSPGVYKKGNELVS